MERSVNYDIRQAYGSPSQRNDMLIITDGNSALLEAIWWHGPHAERISTFLINTLPLALVLSNVATFSIVAVIAIRHYTRKYR